VSERTALITGGSRGLGAGLVAAFLERGYRVATCSRTPSPQIGAWSADPALAGRFMYESLDLTDREATHAFVGRVGEGLGPIEVLVNNAGLARDGVLALFADEDVERLIDVNLRATITITRLVARRMLANGGGGRILTLTSVVGLSGYKGLSVYSATKAALDGFTRSLARELGPRGITVNSIAPGYLSTEMTGGLDDGQLEQIVRRTPLGRLAEPADVAAAALFLASPEARFVTGHVLVVDGGLTA
jgi:3-oxoacyl-[acyl-carrier protein] reductase